MSGDAWLTLVVLVATLVVLATERVPIAAAMAAAVGVLLLTDVIDQSEALSGFSSSAPVTIAALYVLAGAATTTGALSPLIDRLLGPATGNGNGGGGVGGGAGRDGDAHLDDVGEVRLRLTRVAAAICAISAVLPNTPLVALAAPRIVSWCRRTGRSAAPYLMPMSYAAVLGGVITVIGTSTNLIVSDLLAASGRDPLGVFEITGIGLPVAAIGLLVLVLLAPALTRDRQVGGARTLVDSARRYTVAMRVDGDGPLDGLTVEQAGLRHLHGVFLAGIERGTSVRPAAHDTVLAGGDTCYFVGDVTDVLDLDEVAGLTSAEQPHVDGAGNQPDSALYEVVVSERSELAGNTLREVGFRARYSAAVLAIRRHDDQLPGKLGSVQLRPGDVLLVLGTPDFARQWSGHRDFSVVAPHGSAPPPRRNRAWVVIVAIAAMIGLAVFDVLDLMEAALAAAAALLVLRVISPAEAQRSINVNVVLTIALSISLGVAVATSGLAAEIADVLGAAGGHFGDRGHVVAVLLATMLLTEMLANNAAAAVMFPIAIATAEDAGLDPRAMAIVVLIGASCSFLSPIGYQTNTMVYGLGGYRFLDFTRLGAPLTLTVAVVTPILLPLVMPLR